MTTDELMAEVVNRGWTMTVNPVGDDSDRRVELSLEKEGRRLAILQPVETVAKGGIALSLRRFLHDERTGAA